MLRMALAFEVKLKRRMDGRKTLKKRSEKRSLNIGLRVR